MSAGQKPRDLTRALENCQKAMRGYHAMSEFDRALMRLRQKARRKENQERVANRNVKAHAKMRAVRNLKLVP